MTIIARVIILGLIMLASSCDSIKPRTNMITMTSSEYQCANGQTLNTGRWWTDPIVQSKNPNTVILCGGNIPAAQGAGAGNNSCVSVDLYSCQSSPIPGTMSTTRQALQPVCLTNGQCYLFGGNTTTEASTATKSVDVLNLSNQTLQQNALQLPEPRLCSASAALSSTDFIITGGYGVKDPVTKKGPVFNTATRVNSATGEKIILTMIHQRGAHSITQLPDGTLLLLGGNGDDSNGGEIFDPKTNTFTAIKAKMSNARKDHRVIVANDGKVYILGGTMGQAAQTNIEVYDPVTQLFSDTGLALSQGREDAAVVYIRELNIIVAVGGELKGATGEPESNAIDVINLNTNKVYSGRLNTPRDEPTLVVRSIDVAKKEIHLVALTGQRKINGTEVSLPAEEIVISL